MYKKLEKMCKKKADVVKIDAEELALVLSHLKEKCFYCGFDLPYVNSIYRSDLHKKVVIFSLCEVCYNRLDEIEKELEEKLEKRAMEI